MVVTYKKTDLNLHDLLSLCRESILLLSIAPGTNGLDKHGFDLKREINCHSRARNDMSVITVRQIRS